MAPSLTTWLLQLGTAGATRNAALACAERRAAQARTDATMRRFLRGASVRSISGAATVDHLVKQRTGVIA